MILTGNAWTFPQDDISSDLIRAKAYAHLSFQEQGHHCLEDIDPHFAAQARPGDFIVAGRNFGSGSSTAAHGAVVGLGIAAVLAESFGRLFLSNCVSAGLWAVTCPGISTFARSGDRLEVDLARWRVRNLTNEGELAANPLPDFFREMILAGGERAYLETRLARDRDAMAKRPGRG